MAQVVRITCRVARHSCLAVDFAEIVGYVCQVCELLFMIACFIWYVIGLRYVRPLLRKLNS